MKPVIYAALPNKKIDTYDILLNELIQYAKSYGISLSPKSILIDFEMSACKAFSKNFPTAKLEGCQFHFAQNIWRQLLRKGLITYSKDDEVCRQIFNILMLLLLTPEEIDLAFADIIEDLSNINEKFLKLTDYILRTYIEEALFLSCF